MRRYQVTITGVSALLLHHDNIDFADALKAWRQDPANKKLIAGGAGDDRSPAFSWLGCLYEHDGHIVVPGDNIMRCLMEGGAQVPVPGGKNGKTFKAQTQSGILIEEEGWPVLVDGKPIPLSKIEPLRDEMDFAVHKETAVELGFDLFVKRAKVGTSKHIRVRPRFARWQLRGHAMVTDEQITTDVLRSIFEYAGLYKGLGDWRPSSKTPGPYGRFTAEVKTV